MSFIRKKIVEIRYEINPYELTRLRESLHFTVEQFAAIVGWSKSYQYKLESGFYNSISEKTMKEICSAFARHGLNIKINPK